MLFPKLISLNSLNFEFHDCDFSSSMMNAVDKVDGMKREGSGRVGIYKATDIPYSYTLEAPFFFKNKSEPLCKQKDLKNDRIVGENQFTDFKSAVYYPENLGNFTLERFEEAGRAIGVSILDLFECNPITRLPQTSFKSLEGL